MVGSRLQLSSAKRFAALLFIALIAIACEDQSASVEQLLANARQQREKGNHSAAIIQLKNAVQASPENAEARYLLGLTYNETGDFGSGEKELRRALELSYDPAKVVPPLGKALLALGEYQKVLDQVRLEGDPGNQVQAEILTVRAQALIALKRTSEGRGLLEQALAKQPEFPDALLAQARLAASVGKPDEAGKLIERALASAPKSVEAWLMKGDLARAVNPDAAAAAYRKVLEVSPENVPARLNMASLEIAGGRFDEARKQLEPVKKIAPNSPTVRYLEALIEFRKSNYSAAREGVLQVLKGAPNHLPSVLLAGAAEYALGSHAQAQAHLTRVIERAPGNLYARKLLVASLAKSGQALRALEVLQPGLKQAPEDSVLLALAGELSLQTNDFAGAARWFDKAAKVDPKSAGARTGLGVSRLAAGETDRALADLEAAVQLDSEKYQADILLIMSYLQRASYDQALTALQTLEKKQPNNPLTHNLKAAIYLGKKEVPAARKHLERALALKPDYVPAALNLAQLDLQEKNAPAARRRFEAILEKDNGNVQALLALAELAPRLGATQKEQIDWLERARRASPDAVQPHLLLARTYAQIGDAKKALEAAQRAQAANPDNPEVLDTLGAIQLSTGDKNQALSTYTKLAALRPDSPAALYRLANAQMLNADTPGAAATLKKALALKPDFSEALLAMTELELRAGRFPEAMKIARQLQKQNAKSPLGFALEGDVLLAEKKYPQAAAAYEIAYGIGRSGALAMKMHTAYAQAGKPAEGEARLAQWLKESPDDGSVRLYSADASLKRGDYKNAIEHYERIRQKQPDNIVVLNNLAWAYQQTKDPRALEAAERAYKLKPENPAVADTLGWILVERGDTQRGLKLLQKAAADAPRALSIRYHLAQAWLKAGEKAKARDELEGLLSADTKFPEQNEAQNLLKQLRM